MAYPESVEVEDVWGKTPLITAQTSNMVNKENVVEILTKKSSYYAVKAMELKQKAMEKKLREAYDKQLFDILNLVTNLEEALKEQREKCSDLEEKFVEAEECDQSISTPQEARALYTQTEAKLQRFDDLISTLQTSLEQQREENLKLEERYNVSITNCTLLQESKEELEMIIELGNAEKEKINATLNSALDDMTTQDAKLNVELRNVAAFEESEKSYKMEIKHLTEKCSEVENKYQESVEEHQKSVEERSETDESQEIEIVALEISLLLLMKEHDQSVLQLREEIDVQNDKLGKNVAEIDSFMKTEMILRKNIEELHEELHEEQTLSSSTISALNIDISNLRSSEDTLKRKLDDEKERYIELEELYVLSLQKVASLKLQSDHVVSLHESNAALSTELKESNEKYEELEEELDSTQEKNNFLEQQISSKSEIIDSLLLSEVKCKKKLEESDEDCVAMEKEISSLREQLAAKEEKLKLTSDTVVLLKSEVCETKKETERTKETQRDQVATDADNSLKITEAYLTKELTDKDVKYRELYEKHQLTKEKLLEQQLNMSSNFNRDNAESDAKYHALEEKYKAALQQIATMEQQGALEAEMRDSSIQRTQKDKTPAENVKEIISDITKYVGKEPTSVMKELETNINNIGHNDKDCMTSLLISMLGSKLQEGTLRISKLKKSEDDLKQELKEQKNKLEDLNAKYKEAESSKSSLESKLERELQNNQTYCMSVQSSPSDEILLRGDIELEKYTKLEKMNVELCARRRDIQFERNLLEEKVKSHEIAIDRLEKVISTQKGEIHEFSIQNVKMQNRVLDFERKAKDDEQRLKIHMQSEVALKGALDSQKFINEDASKTLQDTLSKIALLEDSASAAQSNITSLVNEDNTYDEQRHYTTPVRRKAEEYHPRQVNTPSSDIPIYPAQSKQEGSSEDRELMSGMMERLSKKTNKETHLTKDMAFLNEVRAFCQSEINCDDELTKSSSFSTQSSFSRSKPIASATVKMDKSPKHSYKPIEFPDDSISTRQMETSIQIPNKVVRNSTGGSNSADQSKGYQRILEQRDSDDFSDNKYTERQNSNSTSCDIQIDDTPQRNIFGVTLRPVHSKQQ